nr:tetratricopeptide repeat protein [Phascolarctobacterium succinatutens]
MVGRYLEEGWGGVTKNKIEAVEWYRKAAEQGYDLAQYNLAVFLANGIGCAKDEEKALKWYKKAAEQGHAKAQYRLADKLYYGKGCQQNKEEALNWYKKAAAKGNADAEEALKWHRKAAKQGYEAAKIDIGRRVWSKSKNNDLGDIMAVAETGNEYAQYIVAEKLYYGKDCDGDKIEALKWYTLAAKRGNKDAQKKLAALMLWCLLFIVVAIGVLFKLLVL